jgi:hypothetical protein
MFKGTCRDWQVQVEARHFGGNMKIRVICEEPDYIDFDEFTIVRWAGYGKQTNFSFSIKTKDGKNHVTHTWYNEDQLKLLHDILVTIDETIDTETIVGIENLVIAPDQPVPVERIIIQREDGSEEVIKND